MDLLVIGADGWDPRLVSYFLSKGHLPNIKRLLEKDGSYGPLASRLGEQDVPHTGPAWTTIYTGQTERGHGATYGGWLDGHVLFTDHYQDSVFSNLIAQDYRVGSFTMPITYPAVAENQDGSWMVAGFPAGGNADNLTDPDYVLDYLPSDYGNLQARNLLGDQTERPAPVDDWVKAERRKRDEVLPELIEEHPVDILFYGTQIADVIGHRCRPKPSLLFRGVNRAVDLVNSTIRTNIHAPRLCSIAWNKEMRHAYEEVDQIIGDLNERFTPERLLVVSDHGFDLDAKGHSFIGCSLATGDLYRPEYIVEIKSVILDVLNIDPLPTKHSPPHRSTISETEQSDIQEQLDILGYRE